MKSRVFKIIICLFMVSILVSCNKDEPKIELPKAADIQTIEIPGGIQDIIIDDEDIINKFITKASEAKYTNKESIQDVPVVNEYVRVDFVGVNLFSSVFIYKDQDKWYIEQPYVGIWQTDENLIKIIIN